MITDLVQIRRLGEKERKENERLRQHLKRREFVERRLRRLAEEVEEQIDCTECANCCKTATVRLVERDVGRIARHLRISQQKFLDEYTTESEDEGLILRRDAGGCVFLDGKLCSIYEERPRNCQYFPHLVRGEGSLQSRMWQMPDRACYCPIVYNTLEAWKDEVGLQRG